MATTDVETAESTPTLETLRRVCNRLAATEARKKKLHKERLVLYRQARAEGTSWRAIARAAKVTDTAVMRSIERAND